MSEKKSLVEQILGSTGEGAKKEAFEMNVKTSVAAQRRLEFSQLIELKKQVSDKTEQVENMKNSRFSVDANGKVTFHGTSIQRGAAVAELTALTKKYEITVETFEKDFEITFADAMKDYIGV